MVVTINIEAAGRGGYSSKEVTENAARDMVLGAEQVRHVYELCM